MSRRPLLVAAAATTAMLTAIAPAAAAVVGGFSFGAAVPGQPISANQTFYSSPGPSTLHASGTTDLVGGEVHPTHTNSIRFPGWAGLAPGAPVDASASMLSTDSGFDTDTAIGGSDGTSVAYDPEGQDYAVSVWVKPDRASGYPLVGTSTDGVSPNIVQKGVSTSTGGFWKMSLGMTGTGTAARWYPFCVFKGGNGAEAAPGRDGLDRFKLEPNTAYKIECLKSGNTATLRVTRVLADSPAKVVTKSAGSSLTVENIFALSVGKKPLSTDPADSYAGTLDDLIVNKG